MDQVKEDQTEKASQSELLVHPVGTPCRNFGVQLFSCWQAATSLFNAASSDNTAEQQAAEDALREAMLSTPSRVRCAPLCSYRACARLARYIFQIGAPDAVFPCQVLRYATRVQIGNLAFICRGGMHTGFPANLPKVIEYSSFLRWRLLAHFLAYHEALGAKLALQFATRLWSMRLGSSAGVSLCLC